MAIYRCKSCGATTDTDATARALGYSAGTKISFTAPLKCGNCGSSNISEVTSGSTGSGAFIMLSYECSQCGNTITKPTGKCPKCNANFFLKNPIKPEIKKPGQDIPCKNCKIDISSDAFVCPNCGTIQRSRVASFVGISGVFVVLWGILFGFTVSGSAPGGIIGMCGLLNVLTWVGFGFFLLKLRKAFETRNQIIIKNIGIPYVELKPITITVTPTNVSHTNRATICKAFRDGHCIVQGKDTGLCTWDPQNWEACSVVIENKKFYGTW